MKMEAVFINKDLTSALPLKKVMDAFFSANTPDSVKSLFWSMFQCWVTKDCNLKAEISDEEIALFFDQLIEVKPLQTQKQELGKELAQGETSSIQQQGKKEEQKQGVAEEGKQNKAERKRQSVKVS